MRYFGSKVTTIEKVYEHISEKIPSGILCDPFGGIGTVGSYFKKRGYSVWCGDILTNAHYFQIARVGLNRMPAFKKLRKNLKIDEPHEIIEYLNNSKSKSSWFINEYSTKRSFFTNQNALCIAGCIKKIKNWSINGWLSYNERAFLLASLINSVDKVANTAGTYYAYLKKWQKKALSPFRYEFLPITYGNSDTFCYLGSASDLISKRSFDILYLDPPYNDRCYARYYHLPETISLQCAPKVHGMSGIPRTPKISSDFNSPEKAKEAFAQLFEKASFRLLAFHYSDNGLISPDEIKQIFSTYDNVEEFLIVGKGYTTAKQSRSVNHRLYIIHND